jgi:hypothetical protein
MMNIKSGATEGLAHDPKMSLMPNLSVILNQHSAPATTQ